MKQFDGRSSGSLVYLECALITDLSDMGHEDIPAHRQVDVRLPNNKVLRLPYGWLRQAKAEDVEEYLDEAPSDVLDGMLDASEEAAAVAAKTGAKKVAVKRANQ